MASIVLPAHNEEAVIGRTLTGLLADLGGTDIEILVVCNGCTDGTAAVARSFGGSVQVIEIDQASKTEALNVGDSVARTFPRIYLDADVEIDGASISLLIDQLELPGSEAAEPALQIEVSKSSVLVRAYYSVWVALHGQQPGDVGCGVYAMSADGRRRFGKFPAILADDAYARAHFDGHELVRVHGAKSVVYAPERAADLLRIKTRSRLGTMQVQQEFPELWDQKRSNSKPLAGKVAALPIRIWPAVPVYVALQLLARRRASRLAASPDVYRWQRDDSSRNRSS